MKRTTDVRITGVALYFLPLELRVPLKFGRETLTSVTCARVAIRVEDGRGRSAVGWGETPLSVQWVWPSGLPYGERHEALKQLCVELARCWRRFDVSGHPIEIGHAFLETALEPERLRFGATLGLREQIPHLAALVCCSPFDLALHDAYGMLHQRPTYSTYNSEFMSCDLAAYLTPAPGCAVNFAGQYPQDYIDVPGNRKLPVWHLVGGKDWLEREEIDGPAPDDGYPVILRDWIDRDGLFCLKLKLRGDDAEWDYRRLVRVGQIAIEKGVHWLSTDFNCTVTEPEYVTEILDRVLRDQPRIYGMILYVEQPFPYELNEHQIDVHSVSARKPLFMDESAHNWQLIQLGRSLGWTGVALKTCKTQTGALLSLCWAKAHGMTLMVQDLTNPMIAQISHVQLGAHAATIMGIESNGMQFYPEASLPEAAVHPGVFQRLGGYLDLQSIDGHGFGYRVNEIQRQLPEPAFQC